MARVGLSRAGLAGGAFDGPKADPADVVRQVLHRVESGADEVLADEMTRAVRSQLHQPIADRLAAMAG